MSVCPEFFDKAYLSCKEFLNGVWKYLTREEFIIKPINGGLTNFIYLCELPQNYDALRRENEPKQVIVRFYGIGKLSLNEGSSTVLNHLTENLLCAILAERKLGPKVFGVFDGGRIEEYIPARCLSHKELYDADISRLIADKVGKIHALNTLPFSKEPNKIFEKMCKWFSVYNKRRMKNNPTNKIIDDPFKWVKSANLEREIEFCRKLAKDANSPIVFCHFDLQPGNILIHRHQVKRKPMLTQHHNLSSQYLHRPRSPPVTISNTEFRETVHHKHNAPPRNSSIIRTETRIEFIDYEYSAYAHRAFDIANHFCEWALDYTSKEYPFFTLNNVNFPNHEQQINFIKTYLKSYGQAILRTRVASPLLHHKHYHDGHHREDKADQLIQHHDHLVDSDLAQKLNTQVNIREPNLKNSPASPQSFLPLKNGLPVTTNQAILATNNSNTGFTKSLGGINGFTSPLRAISPPLSPPTALDQSSVDSTDDDNIKDPLTSYKSLHYPLTDSTPNGGLLSNETTTIAHDTHENVEKLLKEIKSFTLISHLFWTFWSLVQAGNSKIKFGFEARCLSHKELYDADISRLIADKVGKIHALNTLPFSKEPNKIFEKMCKWFSVYNKRRMKNNSTNKISDDPFKWVKSANLEREIEFCRKLAKDANSPIVFCHFDLQPGNILIHRHQVKRKPMLTQHHNLSSQYLHRPRSPPVTISNTEFRETLHHKHNAPPRNSSIIRTETRIEFIDYEYSAYAHRAFDIANHFCEWALDYTSKEYPFFTLNNVNFPTHEQQINFIKTYLKSYGQAILRTRVASPLLHHKHYHDGHHREDKADQLIHLHDQLVDSDLAQKLNTQVNIREPNLKNDPASPQSFLPMKNGLPVTTNQAIPATNNSNTGFTKSLGGINGFTSPLRAISPPLSPPTALDQSSIDSTDDDNIKDSLTSYKSLHYPLTDSVPNGGLLSNETTTIAHDTHENVEKLLKEIKSFTLISHLFWTFWSLVQAGNSKIKFGFEAYAECRYKEYMRLKEKLE